MLNDCWRSRFCAIRGALAVILRAPRQGRLRGALSASGDKVVLSTTVYSRGSEHHGRCVDLSGALVDAQVCFCTGLCSTGSGCERGAVPAWDVEMFSGTVLGCHRVVKVWRIQCGHCAVG